MSPRRFLVGLCAACLLTACEPPEDQETGSIDRDEVLDSRSSLDPAVVAALDSGNTAYRVGDYEGALDHYQHALEIDDDLAAGWFGLYMAHLALGNDAAADSAMARARGLAPGASLIHPERDTTP
jgi:tetratricopeptide (TPR) repeat protein